MHFVGNDENKAVHLSKLRYLQDIWLQSKDAIFPCFNHYHCFYEFDIKNETRCVIKPSGKLPASPMYISEGTPPWQDDVLLLPI